VLPFLLFAVYFALMCGLIGYACTTGRPPAVPDVADAELMVLEPDPGEGGQLAA
jgi:hypothetical protein